MKLFTKEIDKKLAAQYHLGADLNAQVVVAKIFNPYGNGRWFLINSDPADPDYLWAIVQIGDIVEVGSVSRRELETLRVGRFGFPLERDLGFRQRNAQEVYNGVKVGKTYADGGVADEVTNYAVGGLTPGRWYKDNQGVEYKFIGKVDSGPNKDQLLFTDGEKKMYKNIDDFGEKPKENKLFGWFAKGGEVLKKYGFETIDDAVKALKSGEISTTKFMDILYEYEKKSKRKLADGGEINWGEDLGGGLSIGNDVVITETNSQYKGKEGVIIGKEGDKLMVDITSMTPTWLDAKTLISMDGVKKIDAPMANGGMVNIGTIKDDDVYFDNQSGAFSIRVIDGSGNRVNKLNVNTIDDLLNDYPKFRLNENGKKEFKDVMADGGVIKVGDTIRIKDGLNLGSLMNLEGEDLVVKNITKYEFPSGVKLYYHVEYDGNKYEVREDFVADKDDYADGGKLNYNDPVIMAIRAKKDAAKPMVTKPNPNQAQIAMLLKKKARIEKGMEQEAELQGGPKADEYAAKLEQIDNAIKKLRAKKMANGGKLKKKKPQHNQEAYELGSKAFLNDQKRVAFYDKKLAELIKKNGGTPKTYIDYSDSWLKGWDSEFSKVNYFEMADGGKVKFDDKVNSIQTSLLKRKKVAPSVQKDYGKTYNKAEAKESATRIVGAMTAKEKLMTKKKMADGGLVSEKPKYKKLMELEDRARSSAYKAKNFMKWTETTGENFRRRWNKMVLKLRGFNDAEGEESLANTKKEWLEFCKENDIVYNYNFGDILA